MKFVFLLLHVLFGVTGTILAAVALHYCFIQNRKRIIQFALFEFISTSFALITGAVYYIFYYQLEKHIILDGKFPVAHSVFMEVKEHSFILFFLLSVYYQLRIRFTHSGNEAAFISESKMVLLCILFLGLLMSAMGILVDMGFRINQ